ncbi:MAG: arginine--tRNA ligase [Candidatus Pacebacteria bacterium]|nr:arginine--tRNA ligase [Candidatus Paceibacterota bacterium]
MIRKELVKLIKEAAKKLYKEEAEVRIERPENSVFGDYSTNVAMVLNKNPNEIASAIKSDLIERVEVKNGFVNFFISKDYLVKELKEILKEKEKFGQVRLGKGKKVNVEFISANPTGPLTLGNGRGGFCGDVLANVLNRADFKAEREYYVNDAGEQIRKLGHSVFGDQEAVYQGPYIEELKKKIKGNSVEDVGKRAAKVILEEMIKPSVRKMGIDFDVWFSESNLYKEKEDDKVLNLLKEKKLVYESEGALWFESTKFGDDKDRVLIKADGEKTYLASDTAYLKNKFKRGFKKLIFIWGADHYGYINRIKGAAEVMGYKKGDVDIIIMQLVRLIQGGQEVKMSKRTGIYVTIDELIDEVGLDAARFFFLARGNDSHLAFDLDLAKEQSEKNPVYYVQYAYARICSIISKISNSKFKIQNKFPDLKLLNKPVELDLIKQLIILPEIIEDTAKDYQVQRLPQYALDLASSFHRFYQECRVISEDIKLSQARLALIEATRIVLKNTLGLMGVSAPEKM